MKPLSIIILSLAIGCCVLNAEESKTIKNLSEIPFTFKDMESWNFILLENENSRQTYLASKDNIKFKVAAKIDNNDLIMCFCAPIELYKFIDYGEYQTYEWPNPDSTDGQDGIFTMKYQGKRTSLDVHYSFSDKLDTWPTVKPILLSIRPKQ